MFKKGDKMYFIDRTTKEISDIEIVDIKYVFNRRIGSSDSLTEEQINAEIQKGRLSKTKDSYIDKRIKDLEKELGIKLELKK